jgi:hypothetical protein
VQQTEESAAETEAEGQRTFGLESQRRVVELQLFERSAQVLVLVGLDGIDACEDHGLDVLESGDGLGGRAVDGRDRIAHLDVGRSLDTRADIPHVAGLDLLARLHLELQHADLVGVVLAAGVEELHVVALAERAVEDAVIGDDAAERVEDRIENQRLQRAVFVAFRCRDALHDGFEHLLDAEARFARREQDFVVLAAYEVDDLILHLVDHGRIHVDLVEHGDDFEVVADGQVEVRDGLGLDALRGVDHQQGPLARRDGARDLVGEVDVARGVDEVEHVALAVAGRVLHLDGVALDGDALFALEVHVVEHLGLHFALVERVGLFEQAVGQGALPVVDMGYDAEIADVFHIRAKV